MVISLFSLLARTGIGRDLQIYTYTALVVGILFLMFPIGRTLSSGYARRREFFLTLALIAVILIWPASKGNLRQGLEYGWLLAFAYVFGQLSLSQEDVRAIGFGAGAFGFFVVFSSLTMNMFEGWNNNDIAMAGFMGCAVFCTAPWGTWTQKIIQKVVLVVMTGMMLALDSRSCVSGCVILSLFAFGILKPRVFLAKTWLRRLLLLIPVIIAVGIVLFQNSQMFTDLNAWSMEYFNKPIFNGRNTLWEWGLQQVAQNPLLGSGYINNGYWHNCGITALTAFGIVGYGVWNCYFDNIMVDAHRWRDDKTLALCTVAFLTILVQQSFELGMLSTEGSMLPYLIMGIMLGRMRHLKNQEA